MNGSSTGLESADASGTRDPVRILRDALTVFNAAAKAACDVGEYHLQRSAEDAAARCVGQITKLEKEIGERLRRGEGVHGEDPKEATQVVLFGDVDVDR